MKGAAPTPRMGPAEWGLLLVLSGLWGCSFLFYKILVAALPPFSVVFGRVAIAALVLNIVLLVRREAMPGDGRTWRAFLLMGLLNNAIPFSLIAFGETHIASGLASILNATTPMFTALVAHVATANEKLTGPKLAGIGLGIAGVAVLVGPEALAHLGAGDLPAKLAVLLASLSYGFAGVFGRRFRGLAPLKVATGQVTASAVLMLPLFLLVDRPWMLPAPGLGTWAALLGLAVPSTALAYMLFFRILARAGATNVSLVTLLVPVSAVLLGAAVLGEALSAVTFAGMALIALGLACIDGRPLALLQRRAQTSLL